jgi:hypothetical protein
MNSVRGAVFLTLSLSLAACAEKTPGTAIINPEPSPPKDAGPKADAKTPPKDTKPAEEPDTSAPPVTMTDAAAPADTSESDATGTDAMASDVATSDSAASDTTTGSSDGSGTPSAEAKWSYTACDKKALMFPKIDKNNGVFPIGSCPPPADLYRACGNNTKLAVQKATAQTFETGYVHPPEYAIDDHLMTRWSSFTMPTSWLQLDLGSELGFKRIYLAWELAHASDYDIVTSNDGTTWTTLKEVRNGDGFQDIVDVEGKARYVRINGVKRGVVGEGPYGYSLFDVTICGERP